MKLALALSALFVSTVASAAEPKLYLRDFWQNAVIDSASATAMLKEGIPANVWKLYPPSKWGFISQVDGGFTPARTCVITARVTMLALIVTMKASLMRPQKMAGAFDAIPNATEDQRRQPGRDKLKEAIQSVVASLVKTRPRTTPDRAAVASRARHPLKSGVAPPNASQLRVPRYCAMRRATRTSGLACVGACPRSPLSAPRCRSGPGPGDDATTRRARSCARSIAGRRRPAAPRYGPTGRGLVGELRRIACVN